MQKRFIRKVEELRRLIDEEIGSASSGIMLLAVSGGMDSMCLADLWVNSFGPESCALAHCNFNLRGAESDGDEALVTQWADSHGVRLHKVSFDTFAHAADNGLSIEMAARELRYGWFSDICARYGYDAVVTAHHADDNAETLLLNLVRGTGMKGLSGMKPVSPVPCGKGLIMRPMLSFTRKQIDGQVFARKVPYRDDSTNSSTEYRRNSIRHEIFPLLERLNPSCVRTLNREIGYFSDASSIVDEWCRAHLPEVSAPSERGLSISVPSLLSIPQWRYLLYFILEPYGFNSSVLESLEALLSSDRTVSGKRFESATHVLAAERDMLVVNPREAGGHDPDAFVPVRTAGAYHCNGRRFTVEVLPWSEGMPLRQPAGTLVFDADRLRFPFVCRGWRHGDWMVPLGMRGRKKLSDMFTDLKYTSQEKEAARVLVDCNGDKAEQQHVAALLGARMDEFYKVSDRTTSIIKITI